MRRELIESILREAIGPRKGSDEIIDANPMNEYLCGVIVPYNTQDKVPDPDAEQTVEGADAADSNEENPEDYIASWMPSEITPKKRPSSFGIAFTLSANKPSFEICVTWGRYKDKWKDAESRTWQRESNCIIKSVMMAGDSESITLDPNGIRLDIRRFTNDKTSHMIIIKIVNEIRPNKEISYNSELTPWAIFQPSIRILLKDGTKLEPSPSMYYDDALDFLYKDKPNMARGFMCSALWRDIDFMDYLDISTTWPDYACNAGCNRFIKPDIRSEFVPMYAQPSPIMDREGLRFSAIELSEAWDPKKLDDILSILVEEYRKWIEVNKKSISDTKGSAASGLQDRLVMEQEKALNRIKSGIQILKNDENARLAFCFANKAIASQNEWKKKGGPDFVWRPFQIAFILMNIECISNPLSKDREVLDLLWIPTGGGKTEAYLALMAYAMCHRRLMEAPDQRSGAGTAVISRYTLRLLTVQQFRRTLAMVTAAELLRVKKNSAGLRGWRPKGCDILEDWIYGTSRFSCGIWVGQNITPNELRGGYGAIASLRSQKNAEKINGEPAQILNCPICDSILSIPKKGLSEGDNTIFWRVVQLTPPPKLPSGPIKPKSLEGISSLRIALLGGDTVKCDIQSKCQLEDIDIESIWNEISMSYLKNSLQLKSMRASRPGYFGLGPEPGRADGYYDFEIHCPNPDCKLNDSPYDYLEGVPLSHHSNTDGSQTSVSELICNLPGLGIPIPAYTVDEQVYCRVPTIIVGTADKIARLAFEPKAAMIFGAVEIYNAWYGYLRRAVEPFKDYMNDALNPKYCKVITELKPPYLIVQDELHLLDGPLGSMFGLYETAVDGLISGYKKGVNAKYIASTATARNASSQACRLFSRELSLFPPPGMNISDNFFVMNPDYSQGWKEDKPGRVYIGLCTPGFGPNTPMTRIWSRLLKECDDMKKDPMAIFYWTLVGYFNTLKSLGSTWALYRENIMERMTEISGSAARTLDMNRVQELSGRTNSTNLPEILQELENGINSPLQDNPDALFVTSMFGTGVDVGHLSLMLVDGQPKTTSQYIQATGRVGRQKGGIVLTFLRAGRPRDLSHYEMFTGYHHRIHLEVEPPSVSPFSAGALDRACGPVLVAYLRNLNKPRESWKRESDGNNITSKSADSDLSSFILFLEKRLGKCDVSSPSDIVNNWESQIDSWKAIAKTVSNLKFHESNSSAFDVVLGDSLHQKNKKKVVYKDTPQSLREIEDSIEFGVGYYD